MELIDRIKGCVFGGAIGDALGFPVEFMEDYQIFQKYGQYGITEFVKDKYGKPFGYISDDTQMTIFTLNGLLNAFSKESKPSLEMCVKKVYESYLEWLYTQDNNYLPKSESQLLEVKELFSCRAPGMTCLNALRSSLHGSINNRINDSKGCGGIMRISPIPLFMYKYGYSISEAGILAEEVSAITHGHELGYIPSSFCSMLIYAILECNDINMAYDIAKNELSKLYKKTENYDYFISIIQKAYALARANDFVDDLDAIRELGEGWVAEETIAIALYCAIKYQHDFEKGIISAVNHSGDSDSTGAVAGNIIGVLVGYEKIPAKYKCTLELKDLLLDLTTKI